MVLIATHRNVQTVAACCNVAAAAGVRAGFTLAHARSLLSQTGVDVHPYAPREDALGLCRLARWMLRLAPGAMPDEPDGLLLDISGCERLYADESRHVGAIDDALKAVGLAVRLAVAPTFGCAWALARYSSQRKSTVGSESVRDSLAPLPIEALRIDEPTRASLVAVNITRIGELMAIPRGALADRFGPALLTRLDQALGRAFETNESIKPVEVFAATWEFDGPLEDRTIIENTVRGLLDELLDQLRGKGLGASELMLELCPHNASPSRLELSLSVSTVDFAHLWSLLRNRLETFCIAHPVEIVTLRARRTRLLTNRQSGFLGDGFSQDDVGDTAVLGALLDQLTDRLGARSVVCFEPRETYTPECAFASTEAVIQKLQRSKSTPVTRINPALRPSRLLKRPVAIEVMALLPDRPPAWFRWDGRELRVSAGCGPERIASRWWLCGVSKGTGGQAASGTRLEGGGQAASGTRLEGGGRAASGARLEGGGRAGSGAQRHADDARDYYAVQTECGGVFWLFRLVSTGQWFLHGLWA